MRARAAAGVIVIAIVVGLAGCGGANGSGDAGRESDGAADGGDTGATPCPHVRELAWSGDPAEAVTFTFDACDGTTADAMDEYLWNSGTVTALFDASYPGRDPYAFAAFGSRWVAVRISGVMPQPVRVRSDELDVALVCGGAGFANQRVYDGPDSWGLMLAAGAEWICLATTSPHTDEVPENTPFGTARFDFSAF